ncbi:MAG: hypothetical protein DRP76_03165, partial [Candidatus Omnitrophota bacterium]
CIHNLCKPVREGTFLNKFRGDERSFFEERLTFHGVDFKEALKFLLSYLSTSEKIIPAHEEHFKYWFGYGAFPLQERKDNSRPSSSPIEKELPILLSSLEKFTNKDRNSSGSPLKDKKELGLAARGSKVENKLKGYFILERMFNIFPQVKASSSVIKITDKPALEKEIENSQGKKKELLISILNMAEIAHHTMRELTSSGPMDLVSISTPGMEKDRLNKKKKLNHLQFEYPAGSNRSGAAASPLFKKTQVSPEDIENLNNLLAPIRIKSIAIEEIKKGRKPKGEIEKRLETLAGVIEMALKMEKYKAENDNQFLRWLTGPESVRLLYKGLDKLAKSLGWTINLAKPTVDRNERAGMKEYPTQVGDGEFKAEVLSDPLEPTNTLFASQRQGTVAVIAYGCEGSIVRIPDLYMDKYIVGPQAKGCGLNLNRSPLWNLTRIAAKLGKPVKDLKVVALGRYRNRELMEDCKELGITDESLEQLMEKLDKSKTGIYKSGNLILLKDGDFMPVLGLLGQGDVDVVAGSGGVLEAILSTFIVLAMDGEMAAQLIPRKIYKEYEEEAKTLFGRYRGLFHKQERKALTEAGVVKPGTQKPDQKPWDWCWRAEELITEEDMVLVISAIKNSPWLDSLKGTSINSKTGEATLNLFKITKSGFIEKITVVCCTEISERKRKLKEARDDFEKSEAYYKLALTYIDYGMFKEAREALDKAKGIEGERIKDKALRDKYRRMIRYLEAVEILHRKKEDPNLKACRILEEIVSEQREDLATQKAKHLLEALYFYFGGLAYRKGNFMKAEEYYNKILKINPKNCHALKLLKELELRTGIDAYKESLEAIEGQLQKINEEKEILKAQLEYLERERLNGIDQTRKQWEKLEASYKEREDKAKRMLHFCQEVYTNLEIDAEIRIYALRKVAEIADKRVFPQLNEMAFDILTEISKDASDVIKQEFTIDITRCGFREPYVILDGMRDDPQPTVREAVLEGIGEVNCRKTERSIVDFVRNRIMVFGGYLRILDRRLPEGHTFKEPIQALIEEVKKIEENFDFAIKEIDYVADRRELAEENISVRIERFFRLFKRVLDYLRPSFYSIYKITEQILKRAIRDDKNYSYYEIVGEEAKRLKETMEGVDKLLEYPKPNRRVKKVEDIILQLEKAARATLSRFKEGEEIKKLEVDFKGDLKGANYIFVDFCQIKKALDALLINGLEATVEKRKKYVKEIIPQLDEYLKQIYALLEKIEVYKEFRKKILKIKES